MRFIIISISVISFWLIGITSFCQSDAELNDLKRNQSLKQESTYIKSAKQYNSEYDLFFGKLFIFYKKFVSSQDASSCSFTPSCSEYALMAIKKQGIIIGMINFWDRFTRCNGMSPGDYPVDVKNKVLIDPVRDWNYNEN
jgi:uncharacterized protein